MVMDPYSVLRPLLFRLPPEQAHEVVTGALRRLLHTPTARRAFRATVPAPDPVLRVRALGLDFEHPVGLAAGLDKEGALYNQLGALGFSFVEIGTVTAEEQPGNPQPRLFRLPADRALLNRMGFNNPGAASVARHLAGSPIEPILGVNLGKSKVTPLEGAVDDYLRSLALLGPFADYLVVNVSSPNTPGLRTLQDAAPLRALIEAVTGAAPPARNRTAARVPVLVKLAPDLGDAQVEEAVEIALGAGASGIIATNTTISRSGLRTPVAEVEAMGGGGISGAPLRERADQVVRIIHRAAGGRAPVLGVGGIFSAEDAWRRIRAGASLLQLYTGFVYQGPALIGRINRGVAALARREGFDSIADAVGIDA